MPKGIVIAICVVVILIAIGVIWQREGKARRRRTLTDAAIDSRPPELVCQVGTFRFRWAFGAHTISMLLMQEGQEDTLLGHLETVTPEGEQVPYNWGPFKAWCARVVAEAAKAEIRDQTAGLCRDCNQPLHQRHTPECPRNQERAGDPPGEVRLTDCPPPVSALSGPNDPKREHRGGW